MKTMHQSSLLRLFIIIISLPVIFVSHSQGQDVLVKKSGEEIKVIVIEVGIRDIRYKHFDNLQGPDYVVQKSEIAFIRYEIRQKRDLHHYMPQAIKTGQGKSNQTRYGPIGESA